MIYKKARKIVSVILAIVLFIRVPFLMEVKIEAATITATVNQWSYVKPAPYWPCNPMDEFPGGTSVKILEREQEFFYIEYTANGIVKRGYTAMSNFNAADYAGYDWCNQAVFTPGHNNTGAGADVYYGPGGSYAKVGAIDADEGIHAHKPLLVLRTSGSYSFIQYVTNPGTSGHVLFKRGWIQSSKITLDKPTSAPVLESENLVMIGTGSTGCFLDVKYDFDAPYNYIVGQDEATGDPTQLWVIQKYSSDAGVYYKIKNAYTNLVMEVSSLLPVIETTIHLVPESSPNKAQEFAISPTGTGWQNIATRCSGNYMVLHATSTSIQQNRKLGGTDENWNFHVLDKYFPCTYSNMDYSATENMRTLKYYVETEIIQRGFKPLVDEAADLWNARSNFTRIELENCSTRAEADIYIEVDTLTDIDNNNTMGYTVPYRSWNNAFVGERGYFSDSVLRGTKITINDYVTVTERQWQITLLHEMGHALMLDHPFYELSPSFQIHQVNMEWVAYSVMNQGGDVTDTYPKVSNRIENYDMRTLSNKWG
ncbi:MAG: RICIN domain-containing protein [Clostridia bacterium]|nr:RICIN domain-containing protein [Clostridia bacterium]